MSADEARLPEATEPAGRLNRGKDSLAGLFSTIQLGDFGLDLCLEFVRSPLEFVEGPSDLPADFGQFLGPKKDQGKQEEENHFWETQVHESMILPEAIGGNQLSGVLVSGLTGFEIE